jgi:cytidine deaminase
MSSSLPHVHYPEIVLGLAGPIGVDTDAIIESLEVALRAVGYRPQSIRLTEEIAVFDRRPASGKIGFHAESREKMDHGNAFCEKFADRAALARVGVMAIRMRREAIAAANGQRPVERVAYIVRQLKRPEEVEFFRWLYGRQFVLVSAYGYLNQRQRMLRDTIRKYPPAELPDGGIAALADELIRDDENESVHAYGQRLRDTFHLGDVFIDGINRPAMDAKIHRFVQAFFGRSDIAPSKDEFGMYAAAAARLRSADLSRQVGAAIFTDDGEIVTQGCNEVPKAFGGAYWDSEEPDFRDIRHGADPNSSAINAVLLDLFDRLAGAGMLSDKATDLGAPADMVRKLTADGGALKTADIRDLTEYGRVVHAEMHALCDAARLGRSVKGATLYCTTFPCHNCTKHILAAGIKRVVYIEPYPKSRAKELHENEIELEGKHPVRVEFAPFLGISPLLYQDVFQKGRRKYPDGRAKRWYFGEERPMVRVQYPTYLDMEKFALHGLLGRMSEGPV